MSIYIDEVMTIEMIPITHIVGIVRCHSDPNKIPGPVEWTCVAVIDANKKCTIHILNDKKRRPSFRGIRQLKKYFIDLGYHGGWLRAKDGRPLKEVIVK